MGFKLIEEIQLSDLQGTGYIYEHEKTKASVCFILTKDENKTFSIGFRTPPKDNTGLPHILEHSVLCGSRKYPVKDPFIELAKGSLNTFLNAITYSDKTVYPVASMNEQDFFNLKDVYLDAVFYPNIYNNPMIFEQEGWHYELEELEDKVSYKGVVYNEMKGVFSSPEQILFRRIQQELFIEHPYGNESGGDPMDITKLTLEDFLNFHKTYYHPSNSYIFYYGDVDMEKELEWIDRNYLSAFEFLEVDSKIPLVKRMKEPRKAVATYPIAKDEDGSLKSYLSYNVVLNESSHVLNSIGFDILEYLLIDAPGAPVKEALIRKGIGEDVFCSYDSGIREATFSIVAKNCDKNREDEFIEIIEESLRQLVTTGFEEKKVQAAINKFEFKTKEADFGQYPKGVIYSLKALETWLYGQSPFLNFEYSPLFVEIKRVAQEGFLQQLIKTYLLENNHKVFLSLIPDETHSERKQQIVTDELEKYENGLSTTLREALYTHTKSLMAYQEAPEKKEDLEKLPLLKLSDIPKDKSELDYEELMIKDTKVLYHPAISTDIAYVKCSFDVSFVLEEQLPILSLLSRFLTKLSTQEFTYSQLSDEINGRTGGISSALSIYEHKSSSKYYVPKLELSGKSFINNVNDLYTLIREIIVNTDFTDVSRLRELINETKSRTQMTLNSSGHSTALLRAQSYMSKVASYKERLKGVYFYDEVCRWQESNDSDILDLGHYMKKILEGIISADGLTIALTSTDTYRNILIEETKLFVHSIPNLDRMVTQTEISLIESLNEGIKTTSDVQYVAMAADFKAHGFDYKGSLKVLNTIISLDYLWNNVRIKGGAYGGFSGVTRNGMMYFLSYRDPNLKQTLDVYRDVAEFIKSIDMDERELTKYIIGTISPLDQPLTPSLENEKVISLYHSEITHEDILKNRQEILETTLDEIKSHVELYQKIFLKEYLCVLGNTEKIEMESEFLNIRTLN